MPKVTSKIPHDLGQKVALERIKASCEWAHRVSDLKETWQGNVMTFTASIQGVKISGELEVDEESLNLIGKIPLIALPFKNWIPNILRNALKERKKEEEKVSRLNDQPLILFLHIPKAGGTTLGEFIYNQCRSSEKADEGLIKNGVFFMSDGFFRENEITYSAPIQNSLSRRDLTAVIGHFAFGIHKFAAKPFRYVTMLRHPVKRVISLYHYLHPEGKITLEEFLKNPLHREIDNDQTRRIAGVNPAIGEVTEKDLETAKANLQEYFAVVGTTERFNETLVLLKQKLNWTKEIPAYPRNTTGKSFANLPDKSIELIRKQNLFDEQLHQFANKIMDEMIAGIGETFADSLEKQLALNAAEK